MPSQEIPSIYVKKKKKRQSGGLNSQKALRVHSPILPSMGPIIAERGRVMVVKRCGKSQVKIMPIVSCFKRKNSLLAIRYSKHTPSYPIGNSPL